jgi:hypothetical protein
MKITDHLLIILAGFSLYTLTVVFSNNYFAGINQLIPDIFSGRAHIDIGKTFHQVIGSVITGLLLMRFSAKPVLIAFLVALLINIESYFLLLKEYSFAETWSYYQANPAQSLNLIKPLVILPMMTFLLGFIRRVGPEDSSEID